MFYRQKKMKNWAGLNNLSYKKNSGNEISNFGSSKNIIEGEYKGRVTRIFDRVSMLWGESQIFDTVISVDNEIIYPDKSRKSFQLWGNILSPKQISNVIDEYILTGKVDYRKYSNIRSSISIIILCILFLIIVVYFSSL